MNFNTESDSKKQDVSNLMFGFSAIQFLSILFQFLLWYFEGNSLIAIFHFQVYHVLTLTIFCMFIVNPICKYVFFYGNTEWYTLFWIIPATAAMIPLCENPAHIVGHFYYNIVFAAFSVDWFAVMKGYMAYDYDTSKEMEERKRFSGGRRLGGGTSNR